MLQTALYYETRVVVILIGKIKMKKINLILMIFLNILCIKLLSNELLISLIFYQKYFKNFCDAVSNVINHRTIS